MTPKYQHELLQGSDDWYKARCGLLTASEMKHIITPAKLQYSQGEKEKTHLFELAAQRITKHVEPSYISDDMLRGQDDEWDARDNYSRKYALVQECGFITNDKWGFPLGYSPDGLINEEGVIETKSRRQKFHIETIVKKAVPEEFIIQVQTALLVSERKWCDYISYCGGMPMFTLRVEPDEKIQAAILEAAVMFHRKLDALVAKYIERLAEPGARLIPTERKTDKGMYL